MPRILTIYVDKSIVGDDAETLINLYKEAAKKHNDNVRNNRYPDAGFDVLTPQDGAQWCGYVYDGKAMQMKVKTGIRCSMEELVGTASDYVTYPLSFYMYPRSSVSKTCFRLANSVGIIDSGYRGELMAVFDVCFNHDRADYPTLPDNYSRLVQICCGDLQPFVVEIKSIEGASVDELVSSTKRGDGGFGSTGK